MGSAAPAPMRDPVAEAGPDREANPRGIASYVSAEAVAPVAPEPRPQPEQPSPQPVPVPAASAETSQLDRLQNAVLQALTDGNQRILVSMLSAGEWSVQGNELVIKLAESQTIVDMSVSNDAKRIAIASASGVLGRAIKLKIVAGALAAPQEKKANSGPAGPAIGGRGRAEQDPVVRRMQEKFGAEIRTVIDYKEKR
jgi:hypothetical protein